MPDNHFDGAVARHYDVTVADRFEPEVLEAEVAFLADLAGDGAALELGIGTGRVALPLRARGVPVSGIDLSPAMVAELRGKPGGSDVPVTIGDFADTRVDGGFRLVYLVFNTIKNLTTQDAQVACFANAAAHLEPGGHFVVDVMVPLLRHLPPGQSQLVFHRSAEHIGIDEYSDMTERQQCASHHWWFGPDGVRTASMPFRYVWPAELDLMARLAGLRLRERWSSWRREPFTSESPSHVSVWTKPTA